MRGLLVSVAFNQAANGNIFKQASEVFGYG